MESARTGFSLRSLAWRTLVLGLVLGAEALVASVFLDGASLQHKNGFLTGLVRDNGAWVVKGCIGFAALFTTFAYLRYKTALIPVSDLFARAPFRPVLFAAHFAAIVLFGALSAALYGSQPGAVPMNLIAAGWFLAGVAAVALVALASAPWPLWVMLVRTTRQLWIFAAGASLAACIVGAMSWRLWNPASQLTFLMVKSILRPFTADMVVDAAALRIGTQRFTAIISPECSGLEGMGLMLIFGVVWLVLFRHEIRFPQAFALVPVGLVVLFLLNAVRIAVLIMIGNAGAREIAARGFHSQAGWIAFNSVAFGFSVIARRLPWVSSAAYRGEPAESTEEPFDYPAAPYLLPLLAILAAGMISRAMTGTFEWTYSLRLLAALVALWVFRRRYSDVDWKFGWIGPVIGIVVFALWIFPDWLSAGARAHDQMPAALAAAPSGARVFWITCRVIAAVVTVPVAEELAFRGFLLRRFVSSQFEAVSFRTMTVFSVAASSVLFGLLHGDKWLVGTVAGVFYAYAVYRQGRLGDAVAAHATTNGLLAAYVLLFHKWSLW